LRHIQQMTVWIDAQVLDDHLSLAVEFILSIVSGRQDLIETGQPAFIGVRGACVESRLSGLIPERDDGIVRKIYFLCSI